MTTILKPGFAMSQRLPQFDEFKARYPNQIASEFEEERFNPSPDDWFLITSIHYAINNCCDYKNDPGVDYWHIMNNLADSGDCEDFVFTKRFLIDKAGFSLNCFVPVICDISAPYTNRTEGRTHMVLCIRTINGDFISDNIVKPIQEIDHFNYKYRYMLINDTWRGVL